MATHNNNKKKSIGKKSASNIQDKHAWHYFELHANQRISLIKLYIVLLSAYITASGYLIIRIDNSSNTEEFSLMFFSGIFIAVTVIFFLLDRRNRELIHIAEDSLREAEISRYKNEGEEIHQVFIREKYYSDCCCSPRHTTCFTALFIIAIASALFIYFYSWHHSYQSTTCYRPAAQICAQCCSNVYQRMQ